MGAEIDAATGNLANELPRLARLVEQDLRRTQVGHVSDEQLTQAAVAWVLGTLFVRFAEDNGLVILPRAAPTAEGHRAWLLSRFEAFAEVDPGTGLFDRGQNPVFEYPVSEEAAGQLVAFWERRVGQGGLACKLADSDLNTRFLGDLYQDMAEDARKHYALLQTPTFVTDFILNLTLAPAIEDRGPGGVRLIDPVCGSGHFVLGAFERLLSAWRRATPTAAAKDLVGHALRAVHGVDLNPFAVAITRFRLLMAAVRASGVTNLGEAARLDWRFNIALADSLVDDPFTGTYDVVVGNPPYTTVRDRALDKIYRARYDACTGKYALTVPFAQRFFQLARPGGYVGQITSNSFMKREFGRKLVEDFFARQVALTHVIDTSGAFIPGHGMPTVVLVGRNQPPRDTEPVLTVVSLRGEPTLPIDPTQAPVWRSLVQQTAHPGQEDSWTASRYVSREKLLTFPLQLATDEAADVLNQIFDAPRRLEDEVVRIGYFANTGSDDLLTAPRHAFETLGIPLDNALVKVISGSEVRDWNAVADRYAFFPYDSEGRIIPLGEHPGHQRRLWPYRTVLQNRPQGLDKPYASSKRPWYGWHQLAGRMNTQDRLITYSWVATHNHFAALRGDQVPLHSAPVIELPPATTPQHRKNLVAILNSSTVCFWLKHGSNSKGRPDADQTGTGERWDTFYEITATRLRGLPLPDELHTNYADELDQLARELVAAAPDAILANRAPTREALAAARVRWEAIRARMVALQEELDWEVYLRYGILEDEGLLAPASAIPLLTLGERAFEITMARQVAAGEMRTAWFVRHGTKPVTELPEHWPAAYRGVVLRRIEAVQRDSRLRVLERPEFKRRWISPSWDVLQAAALRTWLLDRFSRADLWYDDEGEPRRARPVTITHLTELLVMDPVISQAADLYSPGKPLVDVVWDLLASEVVPYLAALRYRDSGMAKRAAWEQTWHLQREEDDLAGDIQMLSRTAVPEPPRYTSADFLKASYWRHRGKYDVPSERFISYPQTGGRVKDSFIGWAGWSATDRAQVLADLAATQQNRDDAIPLLAGLAEVLPWVKQWTGEQEYHRFRRFLDDSMRRFDLTDHHLNSWRPPKSKRGRPRKQP
ncbi:BREX-2 system adenine-specific DNA-methyltransferase PglX [Micromonospora globbae]|uniref:BREX-2 system adenine-specific DNA-methyltransferase PglX n=1 Tax=Micromonospora globbae TaxID=1894969 RepID=UPI00386C8C0A|nr:BREX-2 system adenine-specific DNA-methyltransferase PglX [Micromonospora globbae]